MAKLHWISVGFLTVLLAPLGAQPVTVYSEFADIDPNTGEVLAPRIPREILSPAVARNAFTSLQMVIRAGEQESWRLYVSQNPEEAAEIDVYRIEESGSLTPIRLPYTGAGVEVFWIDMFYATDAPAQRVKIEPQLLYQDDWVIYPMEARIMRATVPEGTELSGGTAPPGEVMRGFLCGTKLEDTGGIPQGRSVAGLRHRNAQQDRALAPEADRAELQELFGSCDQAPPADNPEWYLRIRDFLYRLF